LIAVEAHYKVKPLFTRVKGIMMILKRSLVIIFLIANYNFIGKICRKSGCFGNSQKKRVSGIKGNVDVNIYNGDLQQLKFITVE
jgi:lysozyme